MERKRTVIPERGDRNGGERSWSVKVLSWSHTERRTRIDKPLELIVFGGFLTIVIGLSVTLLAIVLANTVGVGPTWLPVVALLGIVVSLYLYYVGLETVFREFE